MPKKLIAENIKNITIDQDMVIGFQVTTFPKDQMSIVIQHATGHTVVNEDETECFHPVSRERPINIQGEKLQILMSAKLADMISDNPDMTIYEAIKQLLYVELG